MGNFTWKGFQDDPADAPQPIGVITEKNLKTSSKTKHRKLEKNIEKQDDKKSSKASTINQED